MSRYFVCPQGHKWQPSSAAALTAHLDPLCPECGATAQSSAADSNEIVVVEHVPVRLGPAPVEEARTSSAPSDPSPGTPPAPSPPAVQVAGTSGLPSVRGYDLTRLIGRGATGTVYEGRQLATGQRVAFKILSEELLAGTHDLGRFFRHARTAEHLEHPHIARLYQVGDLGGTPYLAMEYIEGHSLAERTRGTLLPHRQAAELVEMLARAVAHAHQQHLVHHDLKLSNILLVSGEGSESTPYHPKLVDFGLASLLDKKNGAGTASYQAPEQLDRQLGEPGPSADIYALGVILYELLTGRPPFLAETREETARLVCTEEPTPPREIRPNLPRELEAICLMALRKAPNQRYPNAPSLAEDLHRFVAGQPPQARPIGFQERMKRTCRRHPLATGAIAVLVVLVVIATAIGMVRHRRLVDELATSNAQLQDALAGQRDSRNRAEDEAVARHEANRLVEERDKGIAKAERQRQQALQQVKQSDKEKAAALEKRDQESAARAKAQVETRVIEQARKDALRERDETLNRLARLSVARGMNLVDRGDYVEALPWLADALRLAQGDPQREQAHRLRLAAALDQCPRPVRSWFAEASYAVVQLSPDGRLLAAADEEGVVRVWDVVAGKTIGEAMKHASPVTQILFSPNILQLLTLSEDQSALVWDTATGKPVTTVMEHEGVVSHMAWSPNGRRVLTVFPTSEFTPNQHALQVWDAATGKAIGEGINPGTSINDAAFSPDGWLILTASGDRTARLWSADKGQQVGSGMSHETAVLHASFSPDGRKVLTAAADGTARVWEAGTAKPLTPPLKHIQALSIAAFSPDGRRFLTVRMDGRVRIWDTETGQRLGDIQPGDGTALAMFSPDCRYVLTAARDGKVRSWDAATGEPAGPPLPHAGAVHAAAFTPEGRRLLTLSDRTAYLWDLAAVEPVRPVVRLGEVGAHAWFSPDGSRLITDTGTVARLQDVSKNQAIGQPLEHKHEVVLAAFSPDGRRVLTLAQQVNGEDAVSHIHVWNADTGEAIGAPIEQLNLVTHALFSPDGKQLLTASANKSAQVWDYETGKKVGSSIDHMDAITMALFSPDGQQVVTTTEDGTVRVWTTATGEKVGRSFGHKGTVLFIGFSKDNRFIVTAGDDDTARVWETATGTAISSPLKHAAPVVHAVLSGDGSRLATACQDRTARVWDVRTGEPIVPALPYAGAVLRVAFSPDDRWLLAASGSAARVWEVATGEPITPRLPLGPEDATAVEVSFTADGKLITATGKPGDPRGRRVWNFSADPRPAADLMQLVHVLGGHRLDNAGRLVACDEKELRTTWRGLESKYAQIFASSPERARAWHQRGADECEQQQLWTGALAHLDRILAEAPDDADLLTRRARLRSEVGQWDRAMEDYRKVLDRNPQRWDLWSALARAQARRGQWKEAIAAYAKAIELRENQRDLHAGRGQAHAQLSQWDLAATDLNRAISLGSTDLEVWRQYALVRLASSNLEAYRTTCERMLRRFKGNEDPSVVQAVTWTCVLAPDGLPDFKPLLERSQRLAGANSGNRPHVLTLAALEYRTGNYTKAVEHFEQSLKLRGRDAGALEELFLAMTHQRLNQGPEARTWLDRAVQEIERIAKSKPGEEAAVPSWDQRLELQVLRAEAERLVRADKP